MLQTNEPVRMWIGRYAFKHHSSGTIQQWAIDDVGVASNPSTVSHAAVYIVFLKNSENKEEIGLSYFDKFIKKYIYDV